MEPGPGGAVGPRLPLSPLHPTNHPVESRGCWVLGVGGQDLLSRGDRVRPRWRRWPELEGMGEEGPFSNEARERPLN